MENMKKMKKIIGTNSQGEIISYEEFKDEKEFKNKLKKESFEKEEQRNEDRIKTKEWIDYWYAANWSEEADVRYYGLKLFWVVATFPFLVIKRLFLIITKRDFGPECRNATSFFIMRIIPISFLFYVCFCTINKINSVDINKYKNVVDQGNSAFLNPQYIEEQRIKEQKKKEGYIFLGNDRGWYKPQGIPSVNNDEVAKDGDPLNWSKK